jgi:hypothetical protein
MFHASLRPQTQERQTGRKDQEVAKKTFSKAGPLDRLAAFCVVLAALLASWTMLAVVAGPADATFAGGNGKVAFYRNGDVWTMNADGTGQRMLTSAPGPIPAGTSSS